MTPLTPAAMVARGRAAVALAQRLLVSSDEVLARLSGVAGDEVLAVLGEADALPWVDDVVYLGRHADAPGLLLVTHTPPPQPPQLLSAALLRRFDGLAPLAVVGDDVIPLARARPIDRARLRAWLAQTEARRE